MGVYSPTMRRRVLGWIATCAFLWTLLAPQSGPRLVCECAATAVVHAPAERCCAPEVAAARPDEGIGGPHEGIDSRGCCSIEAAPERAELPATAAAPETPDVAPLTAPSPQTAPPAAAPVPAGRIAAAAPCLRGPPGASPTLRAPPACS